MSWADKIIPVREEDGKRDFRGLYYRIFHWRKWYVNVVLILLACFLISFLTHWISHAPLTVSETEPVPVWDSVVTELKWVYHHPVQILLATLFISLVAMALYSLTLSTGFTVLLTGAAFIAMSTVNYFKLVTRNEPLLPWDFILIRAAADIVSDIKLVPTYQILISVGAISLTAFVGFLLNKAYGKRRFRLVKRASAHVLTRLTCFILFVTALGAFVNGVYLNPRLLKSWGVTTNAWNQKLDYETNGVVSNLLINMRYLMVEKPNGYSKAAVQAIVDEIVPSKATSDVKPNIILVMDEAYGDASLLKNFTYSEKVTTTADYLKENAVSGYALTSIFGGGTSISEFMVITGFNTDFLPPGCTPYQQYVNSTLPSYASFLKKRGYSTIAIHPYGAKYWNRNVAYPAMGFEKFVSITDFVNPERKRKYNYISDMEAIKRIITEFETNRSTGKPFFNLTVTMQNHQSYYPDDYPEDKTVKITCSQDMDNETLGEFQSYVTGLRDADEALGYLIRYFRNVDEPTIILFFGDHWGKTGTLDEAFTKAGLLDGTTYSSPENTRKGYSPPFYIWDNYVHKKADSVNLSMYQLIPYMTELYGLEKPLYFDYLTQQSKIVAGSYRNLKLDGNGVATNKPTEEMKKALLKQQMLQYDIMFGKGYALDVLTD